METKNKIIEALGQLQVFFDKHNVNGWRERTKKAIRQIQEKKDIKLVLNNFIGAGMGSLIDLYISADNGHILVESEAEANKELQNLTEQILTTASS